MRPQPPASPVPSAASPLDTSSFSAYLLLALAVLSWAGNFVIGRAVRFDAPPVALTFWRWTLAFVVLAPVTWAHWRARWPVVRRSWKIIALLALFATVLQHVPIYWGLSQTTATNGALLNATSPIFIVLLSVLLLRERLTIVAWLGSLVSLAGVVIIVCRGEPETLRRLHLNRGDIGVLAGTLGWAAYTVCLRWRPSELPGLALLSLVAGAGVAMLAPLYVIEMAMGHFLKPTVASFTGIAYVGIVASVLAYVGWNRGVARVGPARAGPFMYLMLLFTPLLSVAFLDERLQLYHVGGAALIVGGIYLATTRAGR